MINVDWKEYPKEKPMSFPGKTPFYVTIKDTKTDSIYSKISLWDHWKGEFSDEWVIAWAYIPDAHAYLK